MSAIAPLLNQGLEAHQAGQWQRAEQLYRQVLAQDPQQTDALHLLGVLAHQLGDPDTALASISQAIQLSPHQPIYYNSLGEVYRGRGELVEAVKCYTQALRYNYSYPEAHYNLANAQQKLGHTQSAIASYRQVIALNPNLAPAHHNLGVLLKQQGQIQAAIASYRQALTLRPDYALALNSLGVALHEQGHLEEARQSLEHALQLDPKLPEAHLNLGNLLKGESRDSFLTPPQSDADITPLVTAQQCYETALQLNPDWAEAYFTLGNFYKDQGKTAIAKEQYQKALEIQPDYPEAFWNQQLILPILYKTQEEIQDWRDQFTQGLDTLVATVAQQGTGDRKHSLAGLSSVTNFYLQYQGLCDRNLQQQYGELVHQILQANYPQWSRPIQRQVQQRKIRVGFISQLFREHTVGKLFLGWLQALNRDEFEVYGYYLGQSIDDWTTQYQQQSDHFVHSFNQFEATCQQLQRDRLDILVFTDVGMNAESIKLAGLRFAPVQCVTWGHPITTGLPTVDYFLSSEGMEPSDGAENYTENLVKLPNIGIHYTPPTLPDTRKSRPDFGLSDQAVVYLSCQSLYKYLPQYDGVFAQIAQQVPQAQFVFLASPTKGDYVTQQFQARLERAFADAGLDYRAFCCFLPRLSWQDYLQVNLLADVFLDTLAWSGGNTTLEAIACGLPIVTCPGQFMRARHAYAMLQTMKMTETIAATEAEYVEIAVRLGLDQAWRQEIVEQMHNRQNQLFQDQTCVRALEDFLKQATGK